MTDTQIILGCLAVFIVLFVCFFWKA